MNAKRISTAASPIALELVKAHLKVEHNLDDALISGYIAAAVEYIYSRCDNLSLRVDTFEEKFSDWQSLYLSAHPLVTVTSVEYIDVDGEERTLAEADYEHTDTNSATPEIWLAEGVAEPELKENKDTPITVTYTAGHLPEMAKVAIFTLVGNWYENRTASSPQSLKAIEHSLDAMLSLLSNPRAY